MHSETQDPVQQSPSRAGAAQIRSSTSYRKTEISTPQSRHELKDAKTAVSPEDDPLLEDGIVSTKGSVGHKARIWLNRLVDDSWASEIISWLFSLGFFLAVVVILSRFDNRALPDFPYGITLGTLVALFTTLSTTAFMVPVSQGLSQLKWLHYCRTPEQISGFETFDQASRGIWGSIILIFTARKEIVSRFGATITILVLATNAITQQAVTYKTHPVADASSTASAPRTTFFGKQPEESVVGIEFYEGPGNPDSATQAAILSGALHDQALVPFKEPYCSTGNCTWPSYLSLEVCAGVSDLSNLLVVKHKSSFGKPIALVEKVDLPGVMTFRRSNSQVFSELAIRPIGKVFNRRTWPDDNIASTAFSHFENSTVADFYVFLIDYGADSAPNAKAVEINLHYCVRNLSSETKSGISSTRELSKPITDFEYLEDVKFFDYYAPDRNRGLWFHSRFLNATAVTPGSDEDFRFSRGAQQAVLHFTRSMIKGNWFSDLGWFGPNSIGYRPMSVGYHPIGLEPLADLLYYQNATSKHYCLDFQHYEDKLNTYARNLAMTLSNSMRSNSSAEFAIQGVAYVMRTHIRVSWPWVSLLAILVAGSLIFLLAVMFLSRSRKMRLWRTSNVALLQAIDPSARPVAMYGMYDNEKMQQQAKGIRLRLNEENGVWTLAD